MKSFEINEEIKEALREFNINNDDAICYLLALYFGYQPVFLPDILKQKLNLTGIYERTNTGLKWHISLFSGGETAFDWVRDYVRVFTEANPKKVAKVTDSTRRMKALFSKYPDIRKEEVMGAAKLYVRNTDVNYLRDPHYFIEKGRGAEKTNDILDWIEKYRELQNRGSNSSVTNVMQ